MSFIIAIESIAFGREYVAGNPVLLDRLWTWADLTGSSPRSQQQVPGDETDAFNDLGGMSQTHSFSTRREYTSDALAAAAYLDAANAHAFGGTLVFLIRNGFTETGRRVFNVRKAASAVLTITAMSLLGRSVMLTYQARFGAVTAEEDEDFAAAVYDEAGLPILDESGDVITEE
jgi:hypothetical protein